MELAKAALSILVTFAILADDCPGESPLQSDAPLQSNASIRTTAPIRSDEQVLFFTGFGIESADRTNWKISIHGWVFENENNSPTRKLLLSTMKRAVIEAASNDSHGNDLSEALLERRLVAFLADNERRKTIAIQWGDRTVTATPSESDGHFFASFTADATEIERLRRLDRIDFRAALSDKDHRDFRGQIVLMQPSAVLVISDIDDTIKVTEVRDKRAVLRNTFLRPFVAVEGMAERYRGWTENGAQIIYLSASPWQLYSELHRFLEESRFPDSVLELKRVRFKDRSIAELFASPEDYKLPKLRKLIEEQPGRPIVLVGDSGEKDPEIYGQVARQYPDRIRKIFIRDVTNDPVDSPRYQQAFRDVPQQSWLLFRAAEELEPRFSTR
jgi:phosphatidate phosphatase APP1